MVWYGPGPELDNIILTVSGSGPSHNASYGSKELQKNLKCQSVKELKKHFNHILKKS